MTPQQSEIDSVNLIGTVSAPIKDPTATGGHLPPSHEHPSNKGGKKRHRRTNKLFLNTGAFAWGLTKPRAAGSTVRVSQESSTIIGLYFQSAEVAKDKTSHTTEHRQSRRVSGQLAGFPSCCSKSKSCRSPESGLYMTV